jgi:hypothetical protein
MSNPNWFKDLFIDEAKPALHGSPAGSGGNVGGSADWNQNDSAKSGYIKNRPFFIKDTKRTIIFPETTVDLSQEDSGLVFGEIGGEWIYLEAGKTYTVMLNGTSYESVARAIPPEIGMSGFILGNGPLAGADNKHNNEPFCIVIFDEMRLQQLCASIYLKGTNTLSIEYIQEDIQHIDPKYIKDMYSDNRSYTVIEGTVTGEVNSYHQVKLIDNIEFNFNKVETVSLSTSAGIYIKNVPITSNGKWFYVDSNDVYIPLFLVEDGILYTLVDDVCEPGTSVEVTYSLSMVDGKLNKLKSEYSPIVETKINQIFYSDILDTDWFEGSYTRINGKALVLTDESCETVEFIDDGSCSYADINHCSWLDSIEIGDEGVLLNTNLDGQTEHYIQILSISETIKDQYIPSDVAKKQDIENAIEQRIGPENQPVSIPVYQATSTDGKNYNISIGRKPKAGDLFVIVPNMTSTSDHLSLRDYNSNYYTLVGRYTDSGYLGSTFGYENALIANVPALISMVKSNGSLSALIVGATIYDRHQNRISSLNGNANDPNKTVTASYITSLRNGVELYASVWGATNTAENPTLSLNGWPAKPIVDKNGEPIAPDVLVESCLYHFIYYNEKWILVDKLS